MKTIKLKFMLLLAAGSLGITAFILIICNIPLLYQTNTSPIFMKELAGRSLTI